METSAQTPSLRGTILLVDDEEMVLSIGVQMIEKLGHTVMGASSGHEAVRIYRENNQTIDVIILDMVMPDLSGGDAVETIKGINPNVRILLSSGYGRNAKANEIIEKGCDGFIPKPFSMRELSESILHALSAS
jgi:CheY-like chemotaxis protein